MEYFHRESEEEMYECKVQVNKKWKLQFIIYLAIMVVLLIVQVLFALKLFLKAKHIKANLSKRLVCFNIFGAVCQLIFQALLLIGYEDQVDAVFGLIGWVGSIFAYYLIFCNYWYLIRMKRVQLQLNAKAEETNSIINEINHSIKMQNVAVIVGITCIIL